MRLATLSLFAGCGLLGAQAPPADIGSTMPSIAQALGVTCNYCHSAERGSGQPEPKKDIARQMMTMTRELNTRVQQITGNTSANVECVTCHHGVPIPRQIADILMQTLRTKGAAAAAAQYRDLRERFYAREAYDFSEDTLLSLAQRITTSRPDDAIALLNLNIEYNPKSARSYAAIGYAYTRKFDDETAIQYYEKSLEIEPNNVVRGQLESLKMYRKRKQD
ncbi:MAG: photosynthetic reaction center cytochrome c subunit [Bryobacterales bacterium]|nr:photosynthetic reaction center cytochrome c subunit [Bryobacterales bacterium]